MSYEENKALLEVWLREASPYRRPQGEWFRFEGDDESSEVINARGWVTFCTAAHSYRLSFTDTYLGCTTGCRVQRPGENWTRGSDLHDGAFCRETFDRILLDIFAYELVELDPPVVHESVVADGVQVADLTVKGTVEGLSPPGA